MFLIMGFWLFFVNWIVTFASDPNWQKGEKIPFADRYIRLKGLSKWRKRIYLSVCFLSLVLSVFHFFFTLIPAVRSTLFTRVLFLFSGCVMVCISMVEKVRIDYSRFAAAENKLQKGYDLLLLIFWMVVFFAVLAFFFIVAFRI